MNAVYYFQLWGKKKMVTSSANLVNSKKFQLSKRKWLIFQENFVNK